ncbi:MAG TPA: F0F1 ATP synthase subunit A [Flavisolibacter sp.]|nr:F0F1 ATP synthase subunit A [Flavisolibacter sp.]
MIPGRVKCLLVAVFSLFSMVSIAQEKENGKNHINTEDNTSMNKEGKKKFDASEVIFGHVLDAHQFHFFSYKGSDGLEHHATIPLPVILYSPQRGFSFFSSAKFHHGEEEYKGYRLVTNEYKEKLARQSYTEEQLKGYPNEHIIAVNENGLPDQNTKVYDLSITRNVIQMFISLILLVWILTGIAKKYANGKGVKTAPSGFQNAIEPIITFVRDDIAVPNLGHKYKKYMPYLLTVFFFILINNIVGLIPGTANVTGNIAFTLVLGLISFVVILFSSNGHYWGHIFNPPVPGGVKPIMIPVEILGIFTKPIALIVRLFANMIAGHIIIICLISLIFIFGNLSTGVGWAFSPISIAFTVFIYFIEILVAFLQAYIFTALTAVFIGQAFEGSHDDGNHHEDPVIV